MTLMDCEYSINITGYLQGHLTTILIIFVNIVYIMSFAVKKFNINFLENTI